MAPTLKSNPVNTKKAVSFAPADDAHVSDPAKGDEVGDHAPDVIRDEAFLGLPAAQGLVRSPARNCRAQSAYHALCQTVQPGSREGQLWSRIHLPHQGTAFPQNR